MPTTTHSITLRFDQLDAWKVYAGSTVPIPDLLGKFVWRITAVDDDKRRRAYESSCFEPAASAAALEEVMLFAARDIALHLFALTQAEVVT